jgi:hypothetical protein
MRRLIAALLLVTMMAQTLPAFAQPARAPVETSATQDNLRPIIIGLGAIAGVVAFNVVALGIGALPGGAAYGVGATVPAEMSVAMSRVYATTSAVVGAWIAYYSYGR